MPTSTVPHAQLLTPHRSVNCHVWRTFEVHPRLVVRLAACTPVTDSVLMNRQRQNRELITGLQDRISFVVQEHDSDHLFVTFTSFL